MNECRRFLASVSLFPILVLPVLPFSHSPFPVPRSPLSPPSVVAPNRNEHPAGRLTGNTLSVRIEAKVGRWAPDSNGSPPIDLPAFAEQGKALSIPGPLIRVRSGTMVKVSLTNRLDSTLVVHGLATRPVTGTDTLIVAPGATRDVSFAAGEPGTYFYWGSTTRTGLDDRVGLDSQLNGALIVDPAKGPIRPDHIFVLGLYDFPGDTAAKRDERFGVAINGRAWPYTERFNFTVGDSVHWRWINPTAELHPMHLHGFFFSVESKGMWGTDTAFAPEMRPLVVTQRLDVGEAISTSWSPTTPGHWLMHCHIQAHVTGGLPYPHSGHYEPWDSAATVRGHDSMSGLIIGFTVKPRPGAKPAASVKRKEFRMVMDSVAGRLGNKASVGVTVVDPSGATLTTAPRVVGPPLVVTQGEPTRIRLINHLSGPLAIHWHGIELESYYDGVPGWSGSAARTAPHVMPGDSFDVLMTPPRAGTFIYHTHLENEDQMINGLYGPLLVLPKGQAYDSTTDLVQILGGGDVQGQHRPWLNGDMMPTPLELEQGKTYRIRIINILANNSLRVWIKNGDGPAEWTPVAKDGADLPPVRQVAGPAFVRTNVGETYDFAFTPKDTGSLRLEVAKPVQVSRAIHVRAAGTPAPPAPDAVVRQLDHLVIGTPDPAALFSFLVDSLRLPVASPLEDYGEIKSGSVSLGNMTLELVGDPTAAPGQARIAALAFEPYPVKDALHVLAGRGIEVGHRDLVVESGGPSGRDTLGVTVGLPEVSMGTAVFLVEYRTFKPEVRRWALGDTLAARHGGVLGIEGAWEVRMGSEDRAQAVAHWEKVLRPFALPASGPWILGTGPRLALDSSATDGVSAIVLDAVSLKDTKAALEAHSWLQERDGMVALDPARVEGLDFRFFEPEP